MVAAGVMGIPNANYWGTPYNPDGAAGILLIARGTSQGLSKLGWSKKEVKTYLWENSKVPASKVARHVQREYKQDPMPISMSPKGIKIVVAGGL